MRAPYAILLSPIFANFALSQQLNLNVEPEPDNLGVPNVVAQPTGTWLSKYGPQNDMPFSGPLSFAHLPYDLCLQNSSATFDIAVIGMPFDTAVSNRPGARFGPFAIRSGSRRQRRN